MVKLSLQLVLLCAVVIAAEPVFGWGNEATHEALSDAAVKRFNGDDRQFDRYLREELGLEGLGDTLRLDVSQDSENGSGSDGRSRLTQSLNRWDNYKLAPDDVWFDASQPAELDVEQLFRIGVYAEDNPNPRAKHHFHDPVREHGPPDGNHGLDNVNEFLLGLDVLFAEAGTTVRGGGQLRAWQGLATFWRSFTDFDFGNFGLRGRSAPDRALNTEREGSFPSDRFPVNEFALPDAERYLFRGLTAADASEREHYLAVHFLAFGHVLHLLQDMGSVAHTRNDFVEDHILYYSLGQNLEEAADLVQDTALGAPPAHALLDSGAFDAADFWDQGAFGVPGGVGLAEVVNRNFFSASTVADDGYYSLPRTVGCDQLGAVDGATVVTELPKRDLRSGDLLPLPASPELPPRFLSTPFVPRLARCNLHSVRRERATAPRPDRYALTVLDDSVQRDYVERLFPLVIDYSAKFMEFYFEPRIDVVPAGENRFALVNRSGLAMTFDESEVRVFYDDVDGERSSAQVPCDGAGEVTLEDGESVLCDLAAASYESGAALPENRGDFTVVVRGRLGQRGAAITGDPDDWRTGDYVTLFKRVLGTRIAYETEVVHDLEGAADEDAEHQREIATIAFDLTSAQANPPRPVSIETNLTEGLRGSLPEGLRDSVDFFAPSAEAGMEQNEGRIAFSSDLLLEQGLVSGIPAGADVGGFQWSSELRAIDPAGSSLGAAILPPPGETPACNKGCVAPWDLAADRLVYSTWTQPVNIGLSPQRIATSLVPGASSSVAWVGRSLQITSVHGSRALGFERRGVLDTRPQSLFVYDVSNTQASQLLLAGSNQVVTCQPGSSTDPCDAIDTLYSADARFDPEGNRAVMTVYAEPDFLPGPGQEQFDRRNHGDIYVANLVGSPGLYRLHDAGGEASYPVVSPDGQWIAFQNHSDNHLYVVPLTPGETNVRYRVSAEPGARLGLTWLPSLQLP